MFTIGEIIKAINGELISGNIEDSVNRVSLDSRDINEGDLFVPIVGQNHDAHVFIKDVIKKKGIAVITHNDIEPVQGKSIIKVEDTRKALGLIAGYYRDKFKLPLIAVTGSVGKTSTKNIIGKVLESKYNVLKTRGNFNNDIGLPLTLLNLKEEHSAAVIEMGMSGFGEIKYLSLLAKPNIAVITNIGMSHIEHLGSKNNILKAKMEILEGLQSDGIVILNGDDSLLVGMKNLLDYKTIFYGIEEGLDFQAYNIKTIGDRGISFEITIKTRDYKIFVPMPGMHNVYNALVAIIIGLEMGVDIEDIIKSIGEIKPENKRLEIIETNGIRIINDTYNASPASMEAAINVLKDIGGNRKIAILADMLELGKFAEKAHNELGAYAANKVDIVVAMGKYSEVVISGAVENGAKVENCYYCKTHHELKQYLDGLIEENDVILIKGSRKMKMEEIVEYLKDKKNG